MEPSAALNGPQQDATLGVAADNPSGGVAMGTEDKVNNTAQNAEGKVKEATGKATDNESLEAEGKGDQMGANLKQAGEKVKDAFKD